MLPFKGIKVLDLSQGIAGPVAAAILARQGAEVIKVEPPGGDWIRATGASRDRMPANAIAGNLNKRSAAIDAAKPAGRAAVLALARDADVVVENFRAGVMDRLGLGYEDMRRVSPRVVYCSITGFGNAGPLVAKPATDSVAQAFTGMAMANALADGTPKRIGLFVPDNISAIYASQAISAALFAREREGSGRHIRISLAECSAAFQAAPMIDSFLFGSGPKPAIFAPAGEFKVADGYMVVAVLNGEMFARLARAVGRADWLTDPRYADDEVRKGYHKEINAELGAALAKDTIAGWIPRLTEADILFSPINNYAMLRDDAQMRAMGYFAEIDQPPYGALSVPHLPAAERAVGAAPRVGEHTRALLAEAGLPAEEIDALIGTGVAVQFSGS